MGKQKQGGKMLSGAGRQGRKVLFGIGRKSGRAAVSLILAVALLLTGIPFVSSPVGKPGVAHADTSLRVEPNRFNPAKGEKATLLFSFNEADAGAISHPTVIGIARMNPSGGFPTIDPGDILHQEDYPVYDGNGQVKVNRFEWDGTRNGVPVPAGRYLLCVNPTGFDHGGTFYGYVAAVDVEYGDQPKAPASVKLERDAAGTGLLLRGIAETDSRVMVQVWGRDGTVEQEIKEIAVGATGQWSTPLVLAQNRIVSITAAAEKNGQVSPYSEMVRALSYEVPATGQITWENVAGYYYKEDNVAQLVRDARALAADNGVAANAQADSRAAIGIQADSLSYAVPVAAGSRVLVKEPLAEEALNPANAGQFTAAAIAARKIGLRPGGGTGPVDPATGGFVFNSEGLRLQGLPSLRFGVSYSSRDAFDGAMGLGWRHSYDWRIAAGEDGKRELSLPDGSEYEFIPLTGGRYLSPRGMNLELSARGDGMFSLRDPDSSVYLFTADGRLAEFTDANGNKVTFIYSGDQLTRIVTGGASLDLGYAGNRLASVADQSGRTIAYAYDAGGHLASIRLADGAVYSMTYDENGRVNSLTKPESTAALTVSYDEEGRVTGYTDEFGSRTEVAYKVINGDDGGGGDDGGSGSGDTTISNANRRDIPESDKVLLSGTMGNERNAPAYLQVEGLKEAVTPYMEKQKSEIESKLAAYEAAAIAGGSSVADINRAISSWSGSGPAIVKAGGLNLEEGVTFGTPSRPVVLIVEGINTNQPLQITVYGTLIVKGSLNANTKLSVAAHTAAGTGSGSATAGNLWVKGPVHLNNDSSLQIENQLYAGTLTYNNGLLDVAADRVLVNGNLNINTKVDMTIRTEMAVGEIVSNNQTANLTVEDGDLFVREQVSVNNHLSVAVGGLFAVGGNFTPNQRPLVRTGVGSGHTLLKYKTAGADNMAFSTVPATPSVLPAKGRVSALALAQPDSFAASAAVDELRTVTTLTDALNRKHEYEFNYAYSLLALCDPAGSTWTYAYDANGYPVRSIDAEGRESRYRYSEQGALLQSIDGIGAAWTRLTNRFGKPVRIQDAAGNLQTFTYDANGNPTAATNAKGETRHFAYNAKGVLIHSENEEGETTEWTVDGATGQVLSVQDSLAYVTDYERDLLNRVKAVRDGQGLIRTVEYDGQDRTALVRNAADQTRTTEYDLLGRIIRTTDETGAVSTVSYEEHPAGEVARTRTVADPAGGSTVEEYDRLGRLFRKTDANGGVTRYSYNQLDQVESVTDPAGYVTRMEYDRNGQLVKRTDAEGGVTQYEYDERNLLVRVTDAEGGVTAYDYDARGLLANVTDALQQRTRYEYDALGRQVAVIDALNQKTGFAYDKAGRLVSTTLPSGAVWRTFYDKNGQVIGTEDPLGGKTAQLRDERGRVTVYQDEEQQEWTYAYDQLDQISRLQDPNGNSTTFQYDAAGRMTQVTDALMQATAYAYDAMGRLIDVRNARNEETKYVYDPAGNLKSKQDGNGHVTAYAYNALNLPEARTNPLLETTSWTYDGAGRTVSQTAADGTVTRYGYDRQGRMTSRTEADGETAAYGYDLLGRRTSMTDGAGVTMYGYDALNRLTKVVTPTGETLRYDWTANGKKARVLYPDLRFAEYVYDAKDQMTQVTEGQGAAVRITAYTYDRRGAVKSRTTPDNTVSRYEYDGAGQVLEIAHTAAGGTLLEKLAYEYDPVGNRSQVSRTMGGSDEDAPAGGDRTIVTEYAYNALKQLERVQTLNGSTVAYAYDAAGNRTGKSITANGQTVTENYTYNEANRLTRWERGADYKDYAYDGRGNLVSVSGIDSVQGALGAKGMGTAAGLEQPWSLDGTAGVTGQVYAGLPDDNDSPVTGEVYGGTFAAGASSWSGTAAANDGVLDHYTWSASNRLKAVTDIGGNRTEYEYDGDGNRVYMGVNITDGTAADGYPAAHPAGERIGWETQYKKAVQEFHYILDVSEPLPQVLQVTGADPAKWKETYVYGAGGEQLSMSYLPAGDPDNGWEPTPGASGAAAGTEQTLYPLADALGSILALTGAGGEIAARYQYDEFGVPQAAEKFDTNWPGPDNLYGYTGLGYDYSSGLTYARARYYQPELGRFISEDTYEGDVRNPLSLNLYTYVENNPLIYTDPTGNSATLIGAILGGIVGGITAAVQGTDIVSGVTGGALNGALVGLAVDLTVTTGGTATVLLTTAAFGAIGAASGDYVNQVGNNLANGNPLSNSLQDYNLESILVNAGIGAASGALGGATSLALSSFEEGTKKLISQIALRALNSGDDTVVQQSITNAHSVAIRSANAVTSVDFTTGIVYNASQNTITYYVNNEVVSILQNFNPQIIKLRTDDERRAELGH